MAGIGAPIGNDYASRGKRITDKIIKACQQEDWNRVASGIEKLLDRVADGDHDALAWLTDRVEGKPAQSLSVDTDGQPVMIQAIRMVVVQPHDTINTIENNVTNQAHTEDKLCHVDSVD